MRHLSVLAVLGTVAIAGAAALNAGAVAQDVNSISRSIDKAARSVAAEADKIGKELAGTNASAANSKRKSTARKGEPAEDTAKSGKGASPQDDAPTKATDARSKRKGPDEAKDAADGDKETAKFSSSPATTLPDTTTETALSPESAAHAAGAPGKSNGNWPKTLPDAKAEAEAAKKPAPPPTWSEAEITEAKARCEKLLKTIDAVSIPEAPIREGLEGECGAPAPIKLISIGKNPQVSISPPALMTCELAVALHTWLEKDIQPLSKSYLGAEVIRIETMSDYSCRKAYGRVGSKLSEHGKANALDIRGFVTAKGQTAYVLDEWGMTQRDIEAQIAAAKAAAEKLAAEKAAAEKAAAIAGKGKPDGAPAAVAVPKGTVVDSKPSVAVPAVIVPSSKVVDGKPAINVTPPATRPSLYPPGSTGTGLGFSPPSNLGGPKAQEVAAADKKDGARKDARPTVVPAKADKGDKAEKAKADAPVMPTTPADPAEKQSRRQSFLHDVHARGCKIFGTILGPEANEAHRNHFHVDLAPRRNSNFCE